eukprot:GHVU01034340.1.p1 GENE.GHVU01034340.1~~GHVU01034340.1.p1  ORF type:complete len:142 (+),score=5.65 GHVU01034340.1:168-593(+)
MIGFFPLLLLLTYVFPTPIHRTVFTPVHRRIRMLDSGITWPEIRHLFRVTWDYRQVNACLDDYAYPMPDIEENLTYLNGARYFAVLDMVDGYNQCPLAPQSREMFSVSLRSGTYTPTRVPQGASISPPYFQQVMEGVFPRC